MVFQKPNVNLEQSIWFLPKDALFDAAYIAELCNILALKKAYQKHLQENLRCKITPPGLLPLNHPLSMGLLLRLLTALKADNPYPRVYVPSVSALGVDGVPKILKNELRIRFAPVENAYHLV